LLLFAFGLSSGVISSALRLDLIARAVN